MSFKIAYYNAVLTDIRETKEWYHKRQPGLEKRFAIDVKQCIDRIKENPLKYEVRYRNVRLAYCRIFPYAVHFYINEKANQLIIIAIVHQHINPLDQSNR